MNEAHDATALLIKQNKLSRNNFFANLISFWKSRAELKRKIADGVNLIHVYSFYDFIFLFFLLPLRKDISACLSIYDVKLSKPIEIILKAIIRRVDHIFVSSRFVTDQLWSLFDIPPSRITVLAITKYLERKEINLTSLPVSNVEEDCLKLGMFISSSSEKWAFLSLQKSYQ